MFKRYSSVSVIALGVCVASGAWAQQVPTSAQPSVILRELGEEQRPASQLDKILSISEDQVISKDADGAKVFELRGIKLDGGTTYKQKQLDKLAANYMGKKVSFGDLNALAQVLTKQYRDDGYIFSRVIVPPQEIQGGIVHFKAVEGRLTDVEVVGDYKDKLGTIKKMANKIKAEGPSNTKDIERYLLLIDDLPGIKARGVLQPASTPGGGKLMITIEQDGFEGSGGVDNRGSRFLGQHRVTGVGAFNSLFGIHDRTTLRTVFTPDSEELRFFDVSHEEQVGSEGTRVKARFASTSTHPGASLKSLDVDGHSQLFDLEVMHPLVRSRQHNLNLVGGFTKLNSDSDIGGAQVSKDRVRYLRAGARYDFTDALAGVNQFDLEAAKGIGGFNETSSGLGRTRANGEHDFFRTNLSAVRIQQLPGKFSLQVSAAGQYSPDPLLASEEFTVGGGDYGRAYDSGEISGDQGIAGALELRYGGNTEENEYVKSYQLYTFYDWGKVWNRKRVVAEAAHAQLASAGAGVRFNLIHDFSGYVELDKALTREINSEGDKDARIFFNLLKRF